MIFCNEYSEICFYSGFRDIFWFLVNQGFNVKIPTCKGLNNLKDKDVDSKLFIEDLDDNRQLTTSQTSDTRLVTKVTIKRLNNYFFFANYCLFL